MTIGSQQYANLSDDAYENRWVGVRAAGQREKFVTKDGAEYLVLEHYRNPRTGYAGTTYQDLKTGEIVVAHRGTEIKNLPGLAMDLAYTDGSMVVARVNPQAEDAIQMTLRAREMAERQGLKPGHSTPEVSVTGHSLGGCLAQITAHHFDLRAETFNAYGAASLGLRIPDSSSDKNTDKVLNHVMAADVVNAASTHYGRVKIYASQSEITLLDTMGYDNDRSRFDVRMRGAQPVVTLGSRPMSNFTDDDGPGGKDRSILSDPQALTRARQYAPMIERAREDMLEQRSDMTGIAKIGALLTGNPHPKREEPLAPGEPALRAGHVEERVVIPPWPGDERPLQTPRDYKPDERVTIPPVPEHLRRLADPQANAEPAARTTQDLLNGLSPTDRKHYDQAHLIGQRLGLPQDQAENLAMATAARIKEDRFIPHADRRVVMQGRGENGGDRVYVSFHPHGDKEPIFNTFIDVDRAAKTPALESAQKIETIALTQTQEQQRQQALAQSQDGQARELRMA
jgi:hypothetical protein